MEQNQFRIGGVYRDGNGVLVKLNEPGLGAAEAFGSYINHPRGHQHAGGFTLADGRYIPRAKEQSEFHLIPGEVTERGEPIETAPAETAFPGAMAIRKTWVVRPVNTYMTMGVKVEAEKLRPALTWNKPTTVDRWAGFVTKSSTQHQEQQRSFGRFVSPDMQDNGPQTNPVFGSAALVVKG